MNLINHLLNSQFNGEVEFKRIDSILKPVAPPQKLNRDEYKDYGLFPIIDQGQNFLAGFTDNQSAILPKNEYIIFGEHTRNVKYVDFPFAQGADGLKILLPLFDCHNAKFLYYSISNIKIPNRGYNRHWNILKHIKIALPSYQIQTEIVRILDKFTLLKAELEAELEARTVQYEYYRDALLDFSPEASSSRLHVIKQLLEEFCPDGISYYHLDQIFHIKNGYTPSKSNPKFWENGTIPWFRMEDIRENGGILSDSIQKVTPEAVKGELFPKDSIIIATSATIGDHALILTESLANQRFTYLSRKNNWIDLLLPKFIYYYSFILGDWCRNNVNISGFPSVNMDGFRRFMFPVPPLPIQNAIIDILDRFEAIVHDIQDGLPAEIALRQKQYEYYRDKLLTFES